MKGGINRWTFRLEQWDGIRIKGVRVLADSAVVVSRYGQALVRLVPKKRTVETLLGRTIGIRYSIENQGGRLARFVRIRLLYPRGAFKVIGSAVYKGEHLKGGERRSSVFKLRALRTGNFLIYLSGESNANHPGAVVTVRVT